MATDKSEPRIGIIVTVAVSAIITLVALRAMLSTYFDTEARAEQQRKIGSLKPEALINLRSDAMRRLSTGPMSIEAAMSELAAHGRMGAGPDIMPSASRDVAPLQGWVKMPSEVPPAMMAPLPVEAPDAGVAAASHLAGAAIPNHSSPKKTP